MREGPANLYTKDLRSETVEKLTAAEHSNYPGSWSPDGKLLAYWQENPETGLDIWVYSFEKRSPEPFLRTPVQRIGARVLARRSLHRL